MDSSNQNIPQAPEVGSDERVELEARSLAHGGAMVGTVIGPADSTRIGKKAFVRGMIPGERGEARITLEDPRYIEAELVRLTAEPSADRVVPPCPHYESCGGCDLQHMQLAAQRDAKRRMVEETLQIHAGAAPQGGVQFRGAELPGWGYRKRIVLHLERDGMVGFFRRNTKSLVPIRQCLITDDLVNRDLETVIPILLRHPGVKGDLIIENHSGDTFVVIKVLQRYRADRPVPIPEGLIAELRATFKNVKIYHSKRTILHQIDFKDQIGAHAQSAAVGQFSQVNDQANDVLVASVLELCQGSRLTEFYAGAGNFSLPLARAGKFVDAVEASRELVAMGRQRARAEKLETQLLFYRESCERFCKQGVLRSTVLLDPPRSGSPVVVQKILESPQVKEIIYVSCYLPTLCRDLKQLSAAGFSLDSTSAIDMFSQTQHVETVTRLTR